jgi:hypothetical protein
MIRAMAQADLPAVLAIASNAFDRDHAQRAQPEFNEMFGSAALRPFFYVAESRTILVTSEYEFFKKCGFTVLGPLPTEKGPKDVLMFKDVLGSKNS